MQRAGQKRSKLNSSDTKGSGGEQDAAGSGYSCKVCGRVCKNPTGVWIHMRAYVPGDCGHLKNRVPCPWAGKHGCVVGTVPADMVEVHRKAVHPTAAALLQALEGPAASRGAAAIVYRQLGGAAALSAEDTGYHSFSGGEDGAPSDSEAGSQLQQRLSPVPLVDRGAVVQALQHNEPPASSSDSEQAEIGSDEEGGLCWGENASEADEQSDSDASSSSAVPEDDSEAGEAGEAAYDAAAMDVVAAYGTGDASAVAKAAAAAAADDLCAAQLMKTCMDQNMSEKGITAVLKLITSADFNLKTIPKHCAQLKSRAEDYVSTVTADEWGAEQRPTAEGLRYYKQNPAQFGLQGLTTRSYIPVYIRDLRAVLVERLQSLSTKEVHLGYLEGHDHEGNRCARPSMCSLTAVNRV